MQRENKVSIITQNKQRKMNLFFFICNYRVYTGFRVVHYCWKKVMKDNWGKTCLSRKSWELARFLTKWQTCPFHCRWFPEASHPSNLRPPTVAASVCCCLSTDGSHDTATLLHQGTNCHLKNPRIKINAGNTTQNDRSILNNLITLNKNCVFNHIQVIAREFSFHMKYLENLSTRKTVVQSSFLR